MAGVCTVIGVLAGVPSWARSACRGMTIIRCRIVVFVYVRNHRTNPEIAAVGVVGWLISALISRIPTVKVQPILIQFHEWGGVVADHYIHMQAMH